MRTLFVSALLPPAPEMNVFGYAQRANILLQAAARLGDVDLLYYVYPHVDPTAEVHAEWQRYYSLLLGVEVEVTLFPLERPWEYMTARGLATFGWRCLRALSLGPIFEVFSMRSGGEGQHEALRQRLAKRPDLVVVQNIPASVPLIHQEGPLPPVVFDLDGIEHEKILQQNQLSHDWRLKLLNYLILPSVKRCEKASANLAQRTLLCSKAERDSLQRAWKLPGIVTVPNAVTLSNPLALCPSLTVLFIGIYEYWPNRDAAEFLISEIWPMIRAGCPQARLLIAGPKPELIRGYADPPTGVEFRGFVEDLEALYVESKVVTCPLRAGSGTRLKVLEAAAYSRPVVSTSLGAFGLELCNDHDILLRDTPSGFAQACLELLGNDARCQELGAAARIKVERYYSTEAVVEEMVKQFEGALADSH
jgi:glycosyltransferase involved in cell wall biosynthesis